MATILDASVASPGVRPTNFAVSAGSGRNAIVMCMTGGGDETTPVQTVTLGGQSMTQLAIEDTALADVATSAFRLDETGVAAMSGTALVFTGESNESRTQYVYFSTQDSNQGAFTIVTSGTTGTSGSESLVRTADSVTAVIQGHDAANNYGTSTNPLTTVGTVSNWAYAYAALADTDRTASYTWSNAFSRDDSLIIFNIADGGAPAAAIDTMDDPIRLGSTSAHTVSNFGSTINAGNVARDGIQIDGTSPSDTAITWAAQAQNLVTPSAGTGATVTLGDGTDTANVTREFLPETGSTWNAVGTVSGSLVEGDWGFGLGLESSQDAYITRDSDSAIATHNDDGTTTWLDYGTSLVYSWDKNAIVGDDGGLTSITLTNSSGGGGGEGQTNGSINLSSIRIGL